MELVCCTFYDDNRALCEWEYAMVHALNKHVSVGRDGDNARPAVISSAPVSLELVVRRLLVAGGIQSTLEHSEIQPRAEGRVEPRARGEGGDELGRRTRQFHKISLYT